ncbi:hypothetical protein CAEBREN_12408 [Caenorhabditis brenneri]|uniref:SPK domain-containing protein n=1 Tax=Caenorhabditis brenneri TaxID=135651 RepID=G0PLU1_CAEBE|nr:hypothetical protein CAEBREN_12408 [Caenorhabditis brenneri]
MPRTRLGTLLQHRMSSNHKELKKMGVKMDNDFFSFTPEEDNLIRNNWKKYAKFHKFKGTIYEFLGFDKDGLTSKNPKIVTDFEFKFKLWPILCSGLDNRFAKLVQSRISYIFHPYYKEDEGYEMTEARRRMKSGESLSEVCESLKIPPRFMERVLANTRNKNGSGFNTSNKRMDETQRVKVLRLLYESHLDDGETVFSMMSFDFKQFYAKCQENSVDPLPTKHELYHTFREVFAKAEKEIFSHLKPAPTLKKKILYVHEAYTRYVLKPVIHKRQTEKPVMSLPILFNVVFEDYNTSEEWNPPPELEEFASQEDLKKIRQRVERVKENRKRLIITPRSKHTVVVVKKKMRLDEESEVSPSRSDSTTGEVTPSPPASIIGDPEELEEENPSNDLTEFEISTFNTTVTNTSSSFLNKNETILAAGGAGFARPEGQNDTSLGSISNRSTTQKKDETLDLDFSKDIWLQLVAG